MAQTERLTYIITTKGAKAANAATADLDKSVGSLSKSILGIAAVTAVAYKGLQFMFGSAKLLREDIVEYNKLEAIIKATGGAAGVSAVEMDNLAQSIQDATGVSNTLILKAEGMLATFKNIGEDTFPRATQALVDMSAVQGELTANTIALGKALNDPIKGVGALSRVGVQFTAQQKEQIKVMQEAGDIAGAQTVILKELEGQFGGAAAAAALNTDKMKTAFDDLRKSIAIGFEAAIQGVSGELTELFKELTPIAEEIGNSFALGFSLGFAGGLSKEELIDDEVVEQMKSKAQSIGDSLGKILRGDVLETTKAFVNLGITVTSVVVILETLKFALTGLEVILPMLIKGTVGFNVAFTALKTTIATAYPLFTALLPLTAGIAAVALSFKGLDAVLDNLTKKSTDFVILNGGIETTLDILSKIPSNLAGFEAITPALDLLFGKGTDLTLQGKLYEDLTRQLQEAKDKEDNVLAATLQSRITILRIYNARFSKEDLDYYKKQEKEQKIYLEKQKALLEKQLEEQKQIIVAANNAFVELQAENTDDLIESWNNRNATEFELAVLNIQKQAKLWEKAGLIRIRIEEWVQNEIAKLRKKDGSAGGNNEGGKSPFESLYGMTFEQMQEAQEQYKISMFDTAMSINSGLQSLIESRLSTELETLRRTSEFRNASAEEQADMEEKINKKYRARRKALWLADKAFSLGQVYFNTAEAVTKAMAAFPITAGQPWAGIATAMGVAQAGIIAAQPMPAFAKGADYTTSGPQMILVGDNPGGRERVQVTPLSSPNINGPQNNSGIRLITTTNFVTIDGDLLMSQVDDETIYDKYRYGQLAAGAEY